MDTCNYNYKFKYMLMRHMYNVHITLNFHQFFRHLVAAQKSPRYGRQIVTKIVVQITVDLRFLIRWEWRVVETIVDLK